MLSPSPPGAPPPGSLIRGKYRLIRTIGEGAMGVVWAAFNQSTSREVALKLLVRPDPQLRERLLREARACGAIQHRNVVDIYDADQTENGDPFLVMPLLSGETLQELLKRRRRLEPHEAARIARDIARGLQAAHDLGIVHRDLKPSNIFLHTDPGDTDYVVKILDFGVSKVLSGVHQLRTATGMLVGSPAYMSPEQVKAMPDIDHRVDLWTLGVVLFEMLAGVRPIQGKAHEILVQVLNAEIPPLSQHVRQIAPGLDAVVMRCLVRERDRRIRSAAEVAAALEPFTSPSAALRSSGPDWRAAPPSPAGSSPYAQPAPPVYTPAGTMFMGPPRAAAWTPPEEASTLPRAPKPSSPMLGEFGTVKLSGPHAPASWPRTPIENGVPTPIPHPGARGPQLPSPSGAPIAGARTAHASTPAATTAQHRTWLAAGVVAIILAGIALAGGYLVLRSSSAAEPARRGGPSWRPARGGVYAPAPGLLSRRADGRCGADASARRVAS